MRRVITVVLLLVLAGGGSAIAGMADRVGTTFAMMAEDFVKAFQPIDTLVVQVDGPNIYLEAGETSGAQVGQELVVYRKGDVFVHPLTRRALGRFEEILGYAQIRRVHAKFAEATFIPLPDRPAPVAEDGARITRARIRVAVTPVLNVTSTEADFRRVPYMIATTLERSKRFQAVDP